MFRKVKAAYDVLIDADARARYDRALADARDTSAERFDCYQPGYCAAGQRHAVAVCYGNS